MKMHFLSGGRLRMRRSVYVPGADRSESIELPVISVLIRHRHGNVLFDTGCHPGVNSDAQPRWGSLANAMTPIGGPDDNVVSQLGMIGLKPEDIDVVVCSHLHVDHCGCNQYFRRASLICELIELEAARAHDAVKQGYLRSEWDHMETLLPVHGEHDLFGDARIIMTPLPGHTPGMTGLMVNLDRDGSFLLSSDAVPLQSTLEKDALPRNTHDLEAAARSLDEVRRLQRIGFQVIYGHDDQQWQSLRKGVNHYD